MDFSWTILGVVCVVNLLWIAAMFVAQELDMSIPARHSIIPGTNQKFIYMQDFWTMTLGDILGVALTNTAWAHLAITYFGLWQWCTFALLTVAFMVGFAKMCLGPGHKPDMGYPDIGKISWNGILHLPYFGTGVAAGVISIIAVFTGHLRGPVLYVGLTGLAVYAVSFVLEIRSGNFDPLKKEPMYGHDCACGHGSYEGFHEREL